MAKANYPIATICRMSLAFIVGAYFAVGVCAHDGKSPGMIFELSKIFKHRGSASCDSCDPCDAAGGDWVHMPHPIDHGPPVFSPKPMNVPQPPQAVPMLKTQELPPLPDSPNHIPLPKPLPVPHVQPNDRMVDPFQDDTPVIPSSRRKSTRPYPTHEASVAPQTFQQHIRRASPSDERQRLTNPIQRTAGH